MDGPRTYTLAPGLTATVTPCPDLTTVKTADLVALRRTVGELVALLGTAYPGQGADAAVALRALQGLAGHVQRRVEGMG